MTPDDVLTFWLGDDPRGKPLAKAEQWWKKDQAFDGEVRRRFGDAIEQAARGELDAWRSSPRGRLAMVILLDQLSRNAFRETPRAFAQDARAREVAEEALAAGDDAVLSPTEATFLLMPLMHAEDARDQGRCVDGFARLCAAATGSEASVRAMLENGLDFAKQHEAIVKRFGRFPHRNAILGRETTEEEHTFLQQPGSSF